MTMLRREEILNATDLPREIVDTPEWGGAVLVRALTLHERLGLFGKGESSTEASAVRIVIASAIDEDGKPLFTDADGDLLRAKNGSAVWRVAEKAMSLSGLNRDEDDAKNSPTIPSEPLHSSSV